MLKVIRTRRQLIAEERRKLFFFTRIINKLRGLEKHGNTITDKSKQKAKPKAGKERIAESGFGAGEVGEKDQKDLEGSEEVPG